MRLRSRHRKLAATIAWLAIAFLIVGTLLFAIVYKADHTEIRVRDMEAPHVEP
jgi:preprotein translocase subunit SecG